MFHTCNIINKCDMPSHNSQIHKSAHLSSLYGILIISVTFDSRHPSVPSVTQVCSILCLSFCFLYRVTSHKSPQEYVQHFAFFRKRPLGTSKKTETA